jgi:hypothetical protein
MNPNPHPASLLYQTGETMNKSITTKRHEQLVNELPAYADMIDFIDALRKAANIPGSMMHNLDNIQTVIEQAAKLITTQDQVKEEAENQLNEVLR